MIPNNKIEYIQYGALLMVFVVCSLVFVGYFVESKLLTALGQDKVTMKAVTAYLFLASAASQLWSKYHKEWGVFIMTTSAYVFSSYIINEAKPTFLPIFENTANFSLDGDVPSWGTVLCFFTYGTYSLLGKLWMVRVIFLMGLMGMLGHVFDVQVMYYYIDGYSTGMAINTSGLFILISISAYLNYIRHEKKI